MQHNLWRSLILASAFLAGSASAQSSGTTVPAGIPRLVQFSGTVQDAQSGAVTGITFALYKEREGGAPLWLETQNVQLDAHGRFSVLLGATKSSGLPADLFATSEARWLAAQPAGQAEQPRVLLLSVPYALKAGDAETVGGLPPSAFVLAAPANATSAAQAATGTSPAPIGNPDIGGSGTAGYLAAWTDNNGNLGNSVLFQKGTGSNAKIGIGITSPLMTLDVKGGELVRGLSEMATKGLATASKGFNSNPFDLEASSFDSNTQKALLHHFEWQAEPVGNNTSTPSASLNLLFGTDPGTPAETGLQVSSSGIFTFASGQTFPGTGTITSVTAGTDLTGGGTSGDVTLNLDTTKTDARYAQLASPNNFAASQTINGSLGVSSGITGVSTTDFGAIGVHGITISTSGTGVQGDSDVWVGVRGGSSSGVGVQGGSESGIGVFGSSKGLGVPGVWGSNLSAGGIGVVAQSVGDASAIDMELLSTQSGGYFLYGASGGNVKFTVQATGEVSSNSQAANNAASFTKDSFGSPGTLAALQVQNAGANGEVAWLGHALSTNKSPVVKVVLPSGSTTNFLECHIPDGTRKCHITSTGSFVSGSDFAEALPARGRHDRYEPGDVLVMASDGKAVEKTDRRYSRRVIGVYSTRPAVLGAEKGGVSRVDPDDVPVAITGIVPTKVTAENGRIQVGDLLVTSSQPGYAMKASSRQRMLGTIVGKALEPLSTGRGSIRVLVILR